MSSLRDKHLWRLEDLQFSLLTQLEQLIKGIPMAQLTRLFDSFISAQNNGVCLISFASKFL